MDLKLSYELYLIHFRQIIDAFQAISVDYWHFAYMFVSYVMDTDRISVNEMSSPWMTHNEATGSPQISPRCHHHHIQEFGSTIGKIFRGLRKNKKHQSQQLFVPAGRPAQLSIGSLSTDEQSLTAPDRPPPRRLPTNSYEHPSMLLLAAPLSSAHRRISAPPLSAESNSECRSNRSSFIATNDMQLLHIDTEGHGETAGSGFDYITRLHSPTTFQAPTCDEQLVQEKAFERLAAIRSVIDEKNRILGVVNEDIEKLQLFVTHRLSESMDAIACSNENFEREIRELRDEVADVEANLEKLRRDSPEIVPPPVPTRAAAMQPTRWSCLQCTFRNKPSVFRCEKCSIPSLRIDPWEMQMCGCSVCSGSILRLNSADSDWSLASPLQ
uniref:RanBP2-type domain-containing protein n=1 Tax=Parascaris univalens TaxID=6257 RepID=A0A915AHZ5_PARUN